jgi:hypothetical protein
MARDEDQFPHGIESSRVAVLIGDSSILQAPLKRMADNGIIDAEEERSMYRSLGKLVAFVTFGAYFFLNTHLSFALAVCLQARDIPSQGTSDGSDTSSGCSHCCCKKSIKSEQDQGSDSDDNYSEPSSGSESPALPACPCDGKHCPVPGGCAFCNPANMTCLLPTQSSDWSNGPVEILVFHQDLRFLQPFLDGQVRPPRS